MLEQDHEEEEYLINEILEGGKKGKYSGGKIARFVYLLRDHIYLEEKIFHFFGVQG
jgi:hemerythrin superfamily protein